MGEEYKDYIIYECEICGLPFIIPTDGLRIADINQRYLSCPLGHRPIRRTGTFDDLQNCMEKANTYKKVNGRVVQTRQGD